MIRALPVRVYKDATLGDCTNDGVSARYPLLYIPCADGPADISEDSPQLLRLVSRTLFTGKPAYLHVEPKNPGDLTEKIGPMMGGNFVYSCDSRFPAEYPIPVHDRYETVEQYELLSK